MMDSATTCSSAVAASFSCRFTCCMRIRRVEPGIWYEQQCIWHGRFALDKRFFESPKSIRSGKDKKFSALVHDLPIRVWRRLYFNTSNSQWSHFFIYSTQAGTNRKAAFSSLFFHIIYLLLTGVWSLCVIEKNRNEVLHSLNFWW
ncbi:hypothetical protein Pan161_33490 [Gimesia algae]|uniref:Uncharacterized protein n=1 Tax=Gimesia algae TaxID=2527971 RepID=A0A517VFF0_9PLAN|nr:hypothetical protein Pan161_33490 [Gimesia algae]